MRIHISSFLASGLALALTVPGCSYHYMQGEYLESKGRWEEAAIEYRQAWVGSPGDEGYTQALERANKVVARDAMTRYFAYLARKEFRKAFARLEDARVKDPDYEPAQEEEKKWVRVLVGGQVQFDYQALTSAIRMADEINLVVHVNSPGTGEELEGVINLADGTFTVEDLLYQPTDAQLTGYSLNFIGVKLETKGDSKTVFASTQFKRLVNFRNPVARQVSGSLPDNPGEPQPIAAQRAQMAPDTAGTPYVPLPNPAYSMAIRAAVVEVSGADGQAAFVPRRLYVNRKDNRIFVDFGQYLLRQNADNLRWTIARSNGEGKDYFPLLYRNLALHPYFYYDGRVLAFLGRGKAG
ncbi:MAG: hypothetical protein OEV94_01015 [Deltaproteobacteria bacterium]|nr:hypothetical protein [Deltaproteobacteria bacterium]